MSIFRDGIFKGKVVLATGGGSNMISKMVEACMKLGADAIILGRKVETLETVSKQLSANTGRKCLYLSCDVRDAKKLQEGVDAKVAELGRLDFVIAGAAGNFLAPVETLSANAFSTVISIDLLGTYNAIKACLPHVIKSKGSFLAVSATLHYTGTQLQAHASAAKAGVDALSQVLAVELGRHGVRSNILAPGPIAGTVGMDKLSHKDSAPSLVETLIPLQRFGTTDDIANATVFLFSEAASYVTGATLVVDGGTWHISNTFVPYPSGTIEAVKAASKSKL